MKKLNSCSRPAAWLTALLVSVVLAGCSGSRDPVLGTGGIATGVPTVTSVTPANDTYGISITDPVITATFSEAMAPITGAATFTVSCYAPCVSPTGTVALDVTNRVATFTLTPATALTPLTAYFVTITGATSLATGFAMAEPYVYHFTTGAAPGVIPPVPPTVTAVAPANDTYNVAMNNTVITANFSEAMAPITGGASFKVECFAPCVSPTGTVTLDATNRIATYTLTPGTTLQPYMSYVATITGAQNLSAGIAMASPYVWHFRTGVLADTTRPTVTLTAPVTSALNVPTNTAITAVFSEDMVEGSITALNRFAVTCSSPCTSPAGNVTYAVGNRTATFSPNLALLAGTTYTVRISASVTDLALNGLSGNQPPVPPAASDYVWTFTTAAAPAPSAPVSVQALSIKPAANAVGVCPTRSIAATFTVPSGLRMSDTSVNSSTFTITGPGPLFTPVVAASVTLDSATGTVATFTPHDPLSDGVVYTVTIMGGAAGVKDMALPANIMLSNYTWNFTAGPPTGVCLPAVQMGLIATFGIAATAGVTNTPNLPLTQINGDVVLDPVSGAICNSVTIDAAGGFGLCGGLAKTPLINGLVISPLYPDAGQTSGAIKADLLAAFLSITPPAGPPAAGTGSLGIPTNLPAGTTLGGLTGGVLVPNDNWFFPGLYQSLTSIGITGDLTLDAQGDPDAVFIFQSSSTLDIAASGAPPIVPTRILLINGAKASNVWWQVATSATLGTYSQFVGNILASESITMETGASSCGRLLAGAFAAGAFVFDANVVSVPGNGCPE